MIKSGASIFLVKAVIAAAEYYRDRLGFRFDGFYGEPPDFCMVWRNEQCVMLSQVKDETLIRPVSSVRPIVWDAYFWVDDIDAYYKEFKEKGADVKHEPLLKPYGCKEIVVRDLDGYELCFGQEL